MDADLPLIHGIMKFVSQVHYELVMKMCRPDSCQKSYKCEFCEHACMQAFKTVPFARQLLGGTCVAIELYST